MWSFGEWKVQILTEGFRKKWVLQSEKRCRKENPEVQQWQGMWKYLYRMVSRCDLVCGGSLGVKEARPTILKAQRQGPWLGSLSSHQWFIWRNSWGSWQKGAGAVTGFAGPQRSTVLTQIWCRPGPGQAGLSQRTESAQVPVLTSLQISNKVTKVASGTFPGKQACLPPLSQTSFSISSLSAPFPQLGGACHWCETGLDSNPASPVVCYVAWRKLSNLPKTQCPQQENAERTLALQGFMEIEKMWNTWQTLVLKVRVSQP